VGFFRRGLITATLKECGTWPVSRDTLIISNREPPVFGVPSLCLLDQSCPWAYIHPQAMQGRPWMKMALTLLRESGADFGSI